MVACAPNMADLNSNLSVSPTVAGAKCSTASTSIGMALPKPNARDAAMRRKIRLQKLKLLRERNSARNIELEEDETKPSVHDAMNLDGPSSKKQQRMIRNRESAALSRKRKRDRITYLEAEVERLKQINDELLRKLEKYEAASSMISVSHQARQLPHNVKPQVQISARFNPSGSAARTNARSLGNAVFRSAEEHHNLVEKMDDNSPEDYISLLEVLDGRNQARLKQEKISAALLQNHLLMNGQLEFSGMTF